MEQNIHTFLDDLISLTVFCGNSYCIFENFCCLVFHIFGICTCIVFFHCFLFLSYQRILMILDFCSVYIYFPILETNMNVSSLHFPIYVASFIKEILILFLQHMRIPARVRTLPLSDKTTDEVKDKSNPWGWRCVPFCSC